MDCTDPSSSHPVCHFLFAQASNSAHVINVQARMPPTAKPSVAAHPPETALTLDPSLRWVLALISLGLSVSCWLGLEKIEARFTIAGFTITEAVYPPHILHELKQKKASILFATALLMCVLSSCYRMSRGETILNLPRFCLRCCSFIYICCLFVSPIVNCSAVSV